MHKLKLDPDAVHPDLRRSPTTCTAMRLLNREPGARPHRARTRPHC